MVQKLKNIHPGKILFEEFVKPLNMSQTYLAKSIYVPARRINEIVLGKRAITADTALRLAKFFGNSEQFWMGLQDDFELEETKFKIKSHLQNIRCFQQNMSILDLNDKI